MIRRALIAAVTAAAAFAGGAVAAAPLGYLGKVESDSAWQDRHEGYPAVPVNEATLRAVFGPPCSADTHANRYWLVAQDDGKPYRVNFHKKLGGTASSNLDNDIPGHMHRSGLDAKLKRGIWGYACRMKRGSMTQYSVHAWGVAVDVNSAHERPGSACRTVPDALGAIWTSHKWKWGKAWNDCMHFQYATGY
ncbi:MAG TPA: M15 family metallopeptidase [Actinomycetota bacterium]|nr:M15 family metallopeptidase [Actinomycetota bacterium]